MKQKFYERNTKIQLHQTEEEKKRRENYINKRREYFEGIFSLQSSDEESIQKRDVCRISPGLHRPVFTS